MSEEQAICDAWHDRFIDEFTFETFFCELPKDHEGDHICNVNGNVVTWAREPIERNA